MYFVSPLLPWLAIQQERTAYANAILVVMHLIQVEEIMPNQRQTRSEIEKSRSLSKSTCTSEQKAKICSRLRVFFTIA